MDQQVQKRVTNMILYYSTSPEEIAEINVLLGEAFAMAVEKFTTEHGNDKTSIDVVGSHGADGMASFNAK